MWGNLWHQIGGLLEMRDDWARAVKHWSEMGRCFPPREAETRRLHDALLRLVDFDPATVNGASEDTVLSGSLREQAMSFESLGGSPPYGCEFGLVQRAAGAEPLGLLRWSSMTIENLISGLDARFEGVEDPEALEVYLDSDDPKECWNLRIKKYHIVLHTFIPSLEKSREQVFSSAQKRMRYLRDKLIADLENAEKIFVFKHDDQPLTQAAVDALSRAIRAYGPGNVLCVCPLEEGYPESSLELRAPGVWVGRLDFSGGPDDWKKRLPAWWHLCHQLSVQRPNPLG